MASQLSVVLPFEPSTAQAVSDIARQINGHAKQVLLVGSGSLTVEPSARVQIIDSVVGKGNAIREAVQKISGDITVIQDADESYALTDYDALLEPIRSDAADAVFGRRQLGSAALSEKALGKFAAMVSETALQDPLTGLRAFRTDALKGLNLTAAGDDISAEIVVKMAARQFRLAEVPVALTGPSRRTLSSQMQQARTLLRYATVHNDADNAHEGYNTLLRMEGAPNYNAWIGRRIRPHLGKRVLEVGAGIGTITREIEQGRELLIALEMDPFYVERLQNQFRGKPHVQPKLSGVERADWDALRKEKLDTVVLSNVLEHIEDDGEAVRNFRRVLQPGGHLVILVPALPALYGSMDEAVGHFRRYTSKALQDVLQFNGFKIETLEWMNMVGIPGWFLNARILKRRAMPPLQLRLYNVLAPAIAQAESRFKLPVGMSLFAVARAE